MGDERSFFSALIGDGRPLLAFTALGLILAGAFAVYLSVTYQFLPHDLRYLGMTPEALCAIGECRIVHFMFHNRVSLGGSVIAVGVLYLWLIEFPLSEGEPWAWWLLLLSGILGFGSFFTYLGHGYMDTWHAAASLLLVPCFALGMVRTFRPGGVRSLLRASANVPWTSPAGFGRGCLLASAFGLFAAGLTIMAVGMTWVFVPEDLGYLGMRVDELYAINTRLVPLISHDRASFGGGVCTTGFLMFFCVWCGRPSQALWQALCVAGFAGFSTAIIVHPLIGYLAFAHLAPAVAGAAVFATGLALTYGSRDASSGSVIF